MVLLAGAAMAGGAVPGAASAWAAPANAGAQRAAGPWGRAIEVPGLEALNQGENAKVVSLSCTSASNCAAVGYYKDGHLR